MSTTSITEQRGDLIDDIAAALGNREDLATIVVDLLERRRLLIFPLAPLIPTLDGLMEIALDPAQSDVIGDIPMGRCTAHQIDQYCRHAALLVVDIWGDEHDVPSPLHLMPALTARLRSVVCETICDRWRRVEEAGA